MTGILAILSRIDIGIDIADAAAALVKTVPSSHSGIVTTDYLIAAAAQSIGAEPIT